MTVARLLEGGIARRDAQLLLAHVLRRDPAWLAAHPEAEPSEAEAQRFAHLRSRRAGGVPIAYILGSAGFYGREFIVDERVLVPRPETEHLVDEALRFVRGPMRVLDVGTGCGAIACSIAAGSAASVDATDISPGAIDVARENARRLSVAERCAFYEGDLAEPVRGKRYDAIVANLPYIPTSDLPKAPDPASFEPHAALDGGPDGLSVYRRLLPVLPTMVDANALLLFEAAPPTSAALAEMVGAAFPSAAVSVVADYAGLERCVKASL